MRKVFTVDDHWRFFAEFCEDELRAGGPDPHLTLSVDMSRDESWAERVWRAGCYIAVYNAPFGEAIWRDWSWNRMRGKKAGKDLTAWLDENWSKIITRRERRTVRRPEYMFEYLMGYAQFADRFPEVLARCENMSPEERYEVLWDEALTVPRLGRYVALKLLEFFRTACEVDIELPDLRAEGGWSPREMLGYLYPDKKEVALREDPPELVDLANELANDAQSRLKAESGVDLDKFQLQVLLCDYKQSWKGMRQYPGRSIDSEMMYALEAEKLWDRPSQIWESRRRLFPVAQLGEVQGWWDVRKDVAAVLALHHYTWSDQDYDYLASRNDLSSPVNRSKVKTPKPVQSTAKGLYPILPGQLYQSATWMPLSTSEARQRAKSLGITGVVNVWRDIPHLDKVVLWYRHGWMSDGKKLDLELVEQLADEIVAHISGGGRVVVMCQAGRNRSALVTATVVRRMLGCSGKEAVEHVRRIRPRALANDTFATHLEHQPPVYGRGAPTRIPSGDLF